MCLGRNAADFYSIRINILPDMMCLDPGHINKSLSFWVGLSEIDDHCVCEENESITPNIETIFILV